MWLFGKGLDGDGSGPISNHISSLTKAIKEKESTNRKQVSRLDTRIKKLSAENEMLRSETARMRTTAIQELDNWLFR